MGDKSKAQIRKTAGQKLLGGALIRNAESVSRRYRDKATRALCQQVKAAGEQLIELADANIDCAIGVYWQPVLFDEQEDFERQVEDYNRDYPF